MTDAPALDDAKRMTQDEVDARRLRDAARIMAHHILSSYATLGVSSAYMLSVAVEMVFDCLMDIARRDKAAAESVINNMARDLVSIMDQLQSGKGSEEGANGTQTGE